MEVAQSTTPYLRRRAGDHSGSLRDGTRVRGALQRRPTYAGLEVSVAEVGSEDDLHGPRYAPLEVGLGAQLVLVGLDAGVDPFDALDLVAGIVFLDPKGDDF